jgi:hypothetical protein
MRGFSSHSTRRGAPKLVWEAERSDPRYAPPRTLALATAALPLGFATAEATGVRPIGGAVMAALAIAALLTSRSSSRRKAAYSAVLALLFVLSHALAGPIGTWPAIAVVTVAAGAAAFRLLKPAHAAPSS